MAQVTRTSAAPPATAAHSANRASAVARTMAASDSGQIDGLNAGVTVTNREAGYNFDDFRQNDSEHREPDRRTPAHLARIDTSTETFAMVLKADNTETDAEGRIAVRGSRGFAGLLSKAIDTYETNAKVIAGEAKVRGNTYSFVL